mmetsp:Transcript_35810/g.102295  ORF Transcript_35810/g.102295 Transcript_35810/m.102295 type:complete len:337 (-) Transcript_35810:156-1166(-)
MLVGRLRRWHRSHEWGFIFSELHKSDVFVSGASVEAAATLAEGDLVLFELGADEDGQPAARHARRAEPQEVEQAQQAAELPRPDGPAASASSSGPARAPPPDGNSCAVQVTSQTMPPVTAAPRHVEPLRRTPPPPPPLPPSHPAPSGPGSFTQQALSSPNMLHQQPYLAQAQQGFDGYQGFNCEQGYPSAGMYQQGPWLNGDGFASAGAMSPPGGQSQGQASRLLLEPPHMHVGPLDPKALVAVLKAGTWPGRRGQTFRSSRNGTSAQIGREWCDVLRQACTAVEQQSEDAERQLAQSNAQWGEAQWWCGNNVLMDHPHGGAGLGDPCHYSSASVG